MVRARRAPGGMGLSNTRRAGLPPLPSWKLVALGCCTLAAAAAGPWRVGVVSGHSMEPTLRSGSLFVYDRHYYHGKPVRRGDVVVLRGRRGFWIKRVYATEDARFWVWRQPMEGYLRRDPVNAAQQARFKSLAAYQRELGLPVRLERFRVPPGHVFVVGDGPVSEDSRELGTVPVTSIVGRVVYPARRHETWTPRLVEYRFPEPRGAASRLSHAKPRERSTGRRALAQRSPSQRAGRLPATGHPRLVGSYSRPPAERPIANPVPSLRF